MGDGLMAIFNFPIKIERHAAAAIGAAMDIQRRCAAVLERLGSRGGELDKSIGVGVGIHTGEVEIGEFCDDGNTRAGDGCASDCLVERDNGPGPGVDPDAGDDPDGPVKPASDALINEFVFDHADIDQRFEGPGDRERIDREIGGDLADRGQSLAFRHCAAQDHFGKPLPDLHEDRLAGVKIIHV